MRLQLSVRRHALPPIRFIYSTDAQSESVYTIADLLADVNKLVPLESSDGEWGLEEYIVEVAATSDQEESYECFHFQSVNDVLREDDEVTIRGLTSDEIRERRRGGRLQITPDGRHLIDGTPFGKRWRAQTSRPGILIPPRKKRRLLPAEDDETQEDQLLLEFAAGDHSIHEHPDSSDEEDDFSGSSEEDGDDTEFNESPEISYEAGTLKLRSIFDDTDGVTDTEDVLEEIDPDEVQLLLEEAASTDAMDAQVASPHHVTKASGSRKRKRQKEGISSAVGVTDFVGFSSPSHVGTGLSTTHPRLGRHEVIQPNGVEDTSSEGSDNDPSSDESVNADVTSSSGSSDSGSDSSSDTDSDSDSDSGRDSSSDAESESSADQESTSSSSSEASTVSTSTSATSSNSTSGSDSASETESKVKSMQNAPKTSVKTIETPVPGPKLTFKQKDPVVVHVAAPETAAQTPPGAGSKRTRNNNNRAKLRKRLAALKIQGILSEDADFEALKAYEDSLTELPQSTVESKIDPELLNNGLLARKTELIERISSLDWDSGHTKQRDGPNQLLMTTTEGLTSGENSRQTKLPVAHENTVDADKILEPAVDSASPAQKRARLDIASSRRMLFGALGLRTPKTKEAEEALRQKLSQTAQRYMPKTVETGSAQVNLQAGTISDAWKKRLILSAVECTEDGRKLTAPPFPFVQHWGRHVGRTKATHSEAATPEINDDRVLRTTNTKVPSQRSTDNVEHMGAQSRRASDDLLLPRDIEHLPALSKDNIHTDCIICFKELQMNERFEPETSMWKTARVTWTDGYTVRLILARRDRLVVDQQTDREQKHRGLVMPLDPGLDADDGYREMTLLQLISPKLAKHASLEVAESIQESVLPRDDTAETQQSEIVPESYPRADLQQQNTQSADIKVNSLQRHEIDDMNPDAGFHSAVDESLLQSPNQKPVAAHGEDKTIFSEMSEQRPGHSFLAAAQKTRQFSPNYDENWSNGLSSPPTVSMVETVDYPHVSQIEVSERQDSGHLGRGSSSHQDAQRISPELVEITYNSLSSATDAREPDKSLPSQSSQSQHALNPLLGLPRGSDAKSPHSSHHANADEMDGMDRHDHDVHEAQNASDSDSLPSLRTLTVSRDSNRHVRDGRSGTAKRAANDHVMDEADGGDLATRGSVDATVASQVLPGDSPHRSIKVSDSQAPTANMNLLPPPPCSTGNDELSIVDLTISSDAVLPHTNGSDSNEAADTIAPPASEPQGMRRSRLAKKLYKGDSRAGHPTSQDGVQAARDASESSGPKRTVSKRRSQI